MAAYALICQEGDRLFAACPACSGALQILGGRRCGCQTCDMSMTLPDAVWSPGAKVSLYVPISSSVVRQWVASWLDVDPEQVEVKVS